MDVLQEGVRGVELRSRHERFHDSVEGGCAWRNPSLPHLVQECERPFPLPPLLAGRDRCTV